MKKLKIMIVEDSPTTAEILRDLLILNWVCDPVLFYNGKEAWDHLDHSKEHPEILPDLLILDLELPGMSGMEILNHVKTTETLKNIQIIINTGSIKLEHTLAVKKWEGQGVTMVRKGIGQTSVTEIMTRLKNQGLIA